MSIQKTLNSAVCSLIVALLTLALSGCSASRQQPDAASSVTSTPPPQSAQSTSADAKSKPTKRAIKSTEPPSKSTSAMILSEIHQANLKEIAISRMAQQKSSTDEVREYASQLVNDRTSADQEVIALAQKKKIRLGDKTFTRESERSRLDDSSGSTFDKYFLQQAAADQDKLVRSLRQQREDASDDDVEALIDKILPILEQDKELTQVLIKKEQA